MLKASFRSFLSHKGRMVLSAIAILLSVAFVSGTLIFTDTITKTFDNLFKSTSADVTVSQDSDENSMDLAATGRTLSIPLSTVDRVKDLPGVANAHPSVSVENLTVVNDKNKSIGPTGGAPTIGVNWYESDRSPVKLTSGHVPQAPGEIVVDADTADKKHIDIGDSLWMIPSVGRTDANAPLLDQNGRIPTKVVGIATFTTTNPGATLVFLETSFAQDSLLGSPDKISSVELDAAPGVTNDELKTTVQKTLGAGYEVKTKAEAAKDAADEIGTFIDFIKYAMLGFAGIAVLVGIFLIFNTFQMLVAQRTRELGLMRAIGASGKQVRRSVLLEALLLGVIGSTLGLAAGFGLAVGLKALISAVGMNLKGASLVFNAATPITAYLVGTLVTIIAAYIPARRASRVSPMAALRESSAPVQKSLKVRTIIGLVLLAAGVLALVGGATADSGATGGGLLGLGVILTLVAFVVLGPVLARTVIPALAAGYPKLFGSMGRLSRENAMRNPRRTGATAAALMIGVALVAALSVVASSMNDSISKQIDDTFGADVTVQSENGAAFSNVIADNIQKTEGVGEVVRVRVLSDQDVAVKFPDGKSTDKAITAQPGYNTVWKRDLISGDGGSIGTVGKIGISEKTAKDHNLTVGSPVDIEYKGTGQTVKAEVGAIQADEATGVGFGDAVILPFETTTQQLPQIQDFIVFANHASGTDIAAFGAAIDRTVDPFPTVKARNQADYKDLVQKQINVLLYMIYGLLGLAIIIAILGVVNTLALSVVERTREIGLMRAIGASRRQIRRMIRLESMVIAVFGALIGLILGLAWGIVAQRLLASEGLDVLTIPWPTVITVVVLAAIVGLLAALLPALRASRMNVLNAIATE
ncbi:FtsX-like permease family protein [Yinghuangia sp. ASG 101]|uniref:ABC transporter permease n=1 Tax=Yinghuangia sp. ASG 101 TaxID=2896848 RepID=UPI001E34FFDE|nr:ABC transporter permease [Yinghuangia sp. ASG 101]UGQ09641.1 FtsX-like permease family protein [Yinghuangia sp. ASG 101]